MKHGSLFTGIGGFELGFAAAGIETVWSAEVDPFCNRVLATRFPGVPNHGNVEEINGRRIESADVISFGSPCQDLSVAGKRAGLAGSRSGLFFQAARIINECRPAFAIWENVYGALSSNAGRDFWTALYTLRELGACQLAWRVYDSQYVGVPQQRRRIYLVADFRGRRASEILFDAEGCGGHPAPGAATWQSLAGTVGGGAYGTGRRSEDDPNLGSLAYAQGTVYEGNGPAAQSLARQVVQPTPQGETRFPLRASGMNGSPERSDQTWVVENPTVERQLGSNATGGFRFDLDHDTYVVETSAAMTSKWAKGTGGPSGDEILDLVPVVYTIQDAREGVDSKGQNGVGAPRSDTAYTLDTLATQAVALTGQRTHALTSEGADASEDGTGRGTPLAFQPRVGRNGRGGPSTVAAPLTAQAGEDGRGDSAQFVAWAENQRGELRENPLSLQLTTGGGKAGQGYPAQSAGSTIRRFTPLECERLQAFPDGWTCLCMPLEAWIVNPGQAMFDCRCPDGPRYRALGNACTTTVPFTIAENILRILG